LVTTTRAMRPGMLAPTTAFETDRVYRKIDGRVVPILFVSYVFAFLDRINIGYAQLQMKSAIGLTDAQFGFAAGIFFLGYVLFEVPSNMILERTGARKTFLRIMILWGLASAATIFVTGAVQLYALRFLLGVFEAGFLPGILLYLTYWYPSSRRGRVTGYMIFAVQVAGLTGGPASGFIMSRLDGALGLAGWQWCFLLEGVPVLVLGAIAYICLVDKPHDANWLNETEKKLVSDAIEVERSGAIGCPAESLRAVVSDPSIYCLAFLYFASVGAAYTFNFWLPTLIKSLGVTDIFQIGLFSTIPYAAASLGVLLVSRSSDLLRERRWHFVVCALVAAGSLSLLTLMHGSFNASMAILSVFGFAVNATVTLFWVVLATYLTKRTVAVGIAFVSSIGTIGGFVSPTMIGYIKDHTGSFSNGFYLFSFLLLVAALVMTLIIPKRAVEVGDTQGAG
jgi:MFS family permease